MRHAESTQLHENHHPVGYLFHPAQCPDTAQNSLASAPHGAFGAAILELPEMNSPTVEILWASFSTWRTIGNCREADFCNSKRNRVSPYLFKFGYLCKDFHMRMLEVQDFAIQGATSN